LTLFLSWMHPDLNIDVVTCVASAESLLAKGKTDKLFLEKQREDLLGEESLECLVMETTGNNPKKRKKSLYL